MNQKTWTRACLLCCVMIGIGILSQLVPQTHSVAIAAEADGGTFTGQVVLEGDVPKLDPIINDKDPKGADLKACGIKEVPSERLVVNEKSKGIANVFVYMKKAPKDMPASLKQSAEKTVTFDQKGLQFTPHAMLVRIDQTVNVLSDDPVGHNTHTYPIRNDPFNSAIKPNERKGVEVKVKVAESLPMQVKCDIHPWMTSWWLVLDHPYAAVTDADGKFTIKNLPPGEHEFVVWQESAGYIERKLMVKVDAKGANKVIKAPVAKFKP